MKRQTLRDRMTRTPFEPFRLVMSSGESYEVRRPEMAYLTKSDVIVGTESEGDNVPSQYRICSMLHVTAVEQMPAGGDGSPGNGHTRP
ncbi:MAG: hypothetical protein AAF790_05790 [Planctomycetota bacterium]